MNDSERLDRLEAMLGQLLTRLAPQAASAALVATPEPPQPAAQPRGSQAPSAFMAYVAAQRAQRAEPLPDDPEADAYEAHAEKLAAMHPLDRQAFLDDIKERARMVDIAKAREVADLEPLDEDELRDQARGELVADEIGLPEQERHPVFGD